MVKCSDHVVPVDQAFGETSLERKCRFLFGTCLLLLITASFWWYGRQTNDIVDLQDRTAGRLLVDQEMLIRHSLAVARDEKYEPLTRQLSDSIRKKSTHTVRFILPGQPVANDDEFSPIDDKELEIMQAFQKSGRKTSSVDEFRDRMSEDGSEYYYYQPIRADEQICLTCHLSIGRVSDQPSLQKPLMGNSVAEAEGDLMAVAKLTLSREQTRKMIAVNRGILIATAIVTVFLAMVALYAIVRYIIVKPLRHLRDVSDAISRGNTTLRADLNTGDEFEELAVAFNRMLRHLTDAQEGLLEANNNLDGKVDELAQANMRLYELNLLKSDFLATMSHELRTPLNSILGFSEVLGSIDSLDDKQKRYVQNIQKSGRTLLEMINDILDLAKIESGKMETRLSDFRISQVVTAQCDMARPLTERKNIDLECRVDPELPLIHQDQARVQQILNNLLSNAIKFTPEGGRITISVRRDEADFMELDVADTGVGIAEEDQQAIFEKFRQGKTAMPGGDAMTREYSGSGLGLSIVMELCKLLGGEVRLESQLGKGSTFTVRLPWILQEQPRLDPSLVEGFEEFTKQRFEPTHERTV